MPLVRLVFTQHRPVPKDLQNVGAVPGVLAPDRRDGLIQPPRDGVHAEATRRPLKDLSDGGSPSGDQLEAGSILANPAPRWALRGQRLFVEACPLLVPGVPEAFAFDFALF